MKAMSSFTSMLQMIALAISLLLGLLAWQKSKSDTGSSMHKDPSERARQGQSPLDSLGFGDYALEDNFRRRVS